MPSESINNYNQKSEAPFVVILMLNYARANDTIECLNSVNEIDYPNYEVVIIDNSSPDDSFNVLKSRFPNYPIYKTESNTGYTGGINFGFLKAEELNPDYILVLNNDTIVEPDFLTKLVSEAEKDTKVAGLCGLILAEHDRKTVWYAGGDLVKWRAHAVHRFIGKNIDDIPPLKTEEVDFVTGCMILFRTSVLKEIGHEKDEYFMYLDDVEYSARIIRSGYKLKFVHDSVIYHKVIDEKASPIKIYYPARNRMLLIKDMNSGFLRIFATAFFLSVTTLKIIIWYFTKREFSRAAFLALKDYFTDNLYEGNGVKLFFKK